MLRSCRYSVRSFEKAVFPVDMHAVLMQYLFRAKVIG